MFASGFVRLRTFSMFPVASGISPVVMSTTPAVVPAVSMKSDVGDGRPRVPLEVHVAVVRVEDPAAVSASAETALVIVAPSGMTDVSKRRNVIEVR